MKKRKLLSILMSLAITTSLSVPAFADQVSGDAVVATTLIRDTSIIIYANSDGSWSTDLGVFISDPGNSTKQQSDIYSGGKVDGTITGSVGVTLSKNTWEVLATDDIGTYSTEDKVTASGKATVSQDYTVTFTANSDESGISRGADTVTVHVVVPAAPADTTAPVITIDPYIATPTNQDITVTASTNEGTLNSTSHTFTENGSFDFIATDAAGNVATKTVTITNIDKIAPTITGSTDRPANADGWYNADVTVSFAADDASGIASITPSTTILTEGADQSVTGTAVDNAGNSASVTVSGINIDKTAPTITGSTDKTANAAGWYNSDVTVSFDAQDALSGVKNSTAPVILTEGVNQSITGIAADKAGNIAEATVSGINIDKTKPTIKINDIEYNSDTTIQLGDVGIGSPTLSWTASDNLSGLATSGSGSILFNTITKDPVTTPITVTDNAGNTTTVNVTYHVIYNFGGILKPINVVGTKSIFKQGSTIPVKFQLKDASGNYITNAIANISLTKLTGAGIGDVNEIISTSAATTGTLFRYDATNNQYIYNLGTKNLVASCDYKINVILDDGKTYSVVVGLK